MAEINLKDIMDSVEPNSYNYQQQKKAQSADQEREKLKPVVGENDFVEERPSWLKKMIKKRLPSDVDNLGTFILKDFVWPAVKDMAWDMLCDLFGRDKSKSSYGNRRSSRRYDKMYDGGSRSRRRDEYDDEKIDYRHVVLNSRGAAMDVVDAMRDRIDATGSVSVAEMLDIMQKPSKYTDIHYGWTNPNDIGIRMLGGGRYLIDVTEAQQLED